jgi:hypothetical protein
VYANCMYCSAALGTNEAVESFPVGRRLAFDAAKGRLWVVCPRCRRWNLTPLEERWEAIEQCERAFRDTRLRVSTENVGLAKLREGLELVRIGKPARPELAAWRYGGQLGARRRDALIKVTAGAAVATGIVVGGVTTGIITGVPVLAIWLGRGLVSRALDARHVAKLRVGERLLPVRKGALDEAEFAYDPSRDGPVLQIAVGGNVHRFHGADAGRTAGMLLPKVNRFGATDAEVLDAVRHIERAGDPERYFVNAARIATRAGVTRLSRFPLETRLALEMAAHEEAERRALEGELAELERAWQDAEEIAAIADDLFLPGSVTAALDRLKRGVSRD